MAVNKLIAKLRQEQNIDIDGLENKFNQIFGSDKYDELCTMLDVPVEAFLVNGIISLFTRNTTPIVIARNNTGDLLIENQGLVISVQDKDCFEKISLNQNPEDKLNAILISLILSNISKTTLDRIKAEANTNEIRTFADFYKKVRIQLFSLETCCFFDDNGNVFLLNLNLKQKRTTNMEAFCKYECKGSLDTAEISQAYPEDFEIVYCEDNTSNYELTDSYDKQFDDIVDYNLTPNREFTLDEEEIMAHNEDINSSLIISPECRNYLNDYFDLSKANAQPQSVAFYGPSGAGKTVSAQVIARELHRPYVAFKMRENSDEDSLRGNIKKVSGKNGEIEYEDTPIIKALKNGWVCEIQELSCCTNPGAETFFNPILDGTKTFEDATGKTFSVHPDALLIFTYNPSYCESNQVATSLLNRIEDSYHMNFPDCDTVVEILSNATGYNNTSVLRKIYEVCFDENVDSSSSIVSYLQENDIEEELSIRQIINWIKRYTNCRSYYGKENGLLLAAEHTIIQSLAQREPEIQDDLRNILEMFF